MERLKPEQNKEFERLCRDFIAWEYEREKIYGDEKKTYNHFTIYGKNGDRQYGCDVTDQDKRLIVQCKCYDNYDPKAHQRLIDAVKEDYTTACSHFPKMERFVICTNLDAKRSTQDALAKPDEIEQNPKETIKAIAGSIPIDIWFWGDLERMPGGILADNRSYAEDYEKPLFLHKNNADVCLKNLFVLQKYITIRSDLVSGTNRANSKKTFKDLWDRIGAFVRDTEQSMLILESDAGCGKTSLIQSLCWHDRENDDTAAAVLDCRPLLTIRLRDLVKEVITKEGLLTAILDGLGICADLRPRERKAELLRRFPKAVLVLDGFDELCIIDGLEDYEDLLYGLSRERLEGWKLIVTSRPNYIRRRINISAVILELQHFDRKNREAWLANYTEQTRCGQSLGKDLQAFIRSGEGQGVCDAPLTLYLLAAAEDIGPEDRKNLWRLYQRIFHEELAERRYDDEDHPGAKYREEAYRLAGEIAHRMYTSGNRESLVRDTELEALSERVISLKQGLRHKLAARDLAERCMALCCYWKSQTARGAVEFYHNNIRDFFLCEYIYDGLNRIYHYEEWNSEQKVGAILKFFRDNFCVTCLDDKVVEFLHFRASWGKDRKLQDFPALERKLKLLPILFQQFLVDGSVFNDLHEKRLFPAITAIISCTAQVYRAVLDPWNEQLCWWTNVNTVNEARLLRAVAPDLFKMKGNSNLYIPTWRSWSSCAKLCDLDLSHTNLRLAFFQGADMQRADLRGADLQGADLRGAKLQKANLQDANLRKVDLHGTKLQGADLSRVTLKDAFLKDTDLRQAKLQGADLLEADLSEILMQETDLQDADLRRATMIGAKLQCADLQKADLQGAKLRGAEMRGAKLCGANLQLASLLLADIQGADLQGADLRGADLQGADLRGVYLQKANLRGANLQGANMQGANLEHANLQETNMQETDLQDAYLYGADLQGTDLQGTILRRAVLLDGFSHDNQRKQLAHLRGLNIDGLIL